MPGHITGNTTWTNTSSTPVTATQLENLEAVADNTHPFAGLRTQKLYMAQAERATLTQNVEFTLCNVTGPGVIRSIWLAIPTNASLDTRLRVYYDGSGTAAFDVDLGTLMVMHYGGGAVVGSHSTPHLSAQMNSANFNAGYMLTYPMPFGTSIKITVINPDATVTANFFHMVTYNLSTTDRANGTRFRIAYAGIVAPATIAAASTYTLANITTGPGWIVGLSLVGGISATNASWMERDFQFAVDGEATPSPGSGTQIVTTGTEDTFDSAWYYNAWDDFQSSMHSYIGADQPVATPYIVAQTTDFWSKWGGIPFNSTCVASWLGEAVTTTTTNFTYALMYYN